MGNLKTNIFSLIVIVLILILPVLCFSPVSGESSPNFTTTITASIDDVSSICIFGVNPNAPVNYSSAYDSLALRNSELNSWFSYYNQSYPKGEMKLSQYIVPTEGSTIWYYKVQPYKSGDITLAWGNPQITDNATMTFETYYGKPLANMKEVSNFTFGPIDPSNYGTPEEFMIVYSNPDLTPTSTPTPSETATTTSTSISTPTSTPSVPEFSYLTILPILLAITIAVAAVRKRLQRNV
jgi:hypothetical protein